MSIKIATGVVHTIPQDMKKALISNKGALLAWNSITPLARNEWICWSITVKKAETRKEHIERMVKQLNEGKRRPCCWIGCIHRTDKPISPSIRNLVINRNKSK